MQVSALWMSDNCRDRHSSLSIYGASADDLDKQILGGNDVIE